MKLVTSFILLRLDYCNFHLSGLLASSVHTFVASRTVLLASSGGGGGGGGREIDHITPLFQSFHWLATFALESVWCVLFSHFTGQKVLSIVTISATKMNKRM